MDPLYVVTVLFAFVAVVLATEGAFLVWNAHRGPEARRIEERLRLLSAGAHASAGVSLVKQRMLSQLPAMQRLLLRIPHAHALDRLLVQAGSTGSVAQLMALSGGWAFLGLVLALLFHAPFWAALLAAAGAAPMPLLNLLAKRRLRLLKLDEQLPDAFDLIGRALRAGHAFSTALQMVGDEAQEPIASEFRLIFDEINFGIPIRDALNNFAQRVPLADVRYFVVAVLIQRETGGNLAELLDNIAALVRARFKLLGTIRVLAAEGRMSAWVLSLLPFGAAVAIQVVNPGFLHILFTDPLGRRLIAMNLLMMVIGILWMWRIVKIRV